MSETAPDEQKRPATGPQERHDALLEQVRQRAPEVAKEYFEARVEMLGCADLMARAFTANDAQSIRLAREVRSCVARVALRWARARAGLVKCLDP